jgi:hypothetical protein
MKAPRLSPPWRPSIALVLAALWLVGCTEQPTTPDDSSITAAKGGNKPGGDPITVDAVDPDSAVQDTTLDVQVFGSGYDQSAAVTFEKPGGGRLTTNSTAFMSETELVANVTVAIDADTGSYDVVVQASKGRKGIGSELFEVKVNPGIGNKPPAPAIALGDYGQLWVINPNGSNETRILPVDTIGGPNLFSKPSWSPLGSGTLDDPWSLAFDDGVCNSVWRINVDTVGGTPRARDLTQLNTPAGCDPDWSPNGDEIAFSEWSTQYPPSSLWVVPAAGGQPELLHSGPVEIEVSVDTVNGEIVVDTMIVSYVGINWLTWSRDGRHIAFDERPGAADALNLIDRSTGVVTTLLTKADHEAVAGGTFASWPSALDWARTRDEILFWASLQTGRRWETNLYVLRLQPDGAGGFIRDGFPVKLIQGSHASWSPDDSEIVYNDRQGRLRVYDVATGETRRLSGRGGGVDWREPPPDN